MAGHDVMTCLTISGAPGTVGTDWKGCSSVCACYDRRAVWCPSHGGHGDRSHLRFLYGAASIAIPFLHGTLLLFIKIITAHHSAPYPHLSMAHPCRPVLLSYSLNSSVIPHHIFNSNPALYSSSFLCPARGTAWPAACLLA